MPWRHLLFLKVKGNRSLRGTAVPYLWLALCLGLGIGMVCFPEVVFTAAKRGLQTWWDIVLPSLLPFFVISELLMNLGFVSLLGRILEPVMKPLFNLPGCSGFILGMSYLSGSPLCAILTSRLRREGFCTREEGERLIAFTSNASPLFMLGAISVGMFGNPALGPFIALIHYGSNLLCGLFLKLLRRKSSARATVRINPNRPAISFGKYNPPQGAGFGSLLGETVRNASTTLLTIGGFITLFSVVVEIIQTTGIYPLLIRLLLPVVGRFHIDATLLRSLFYGFFEMTVGINEASKSSGSLLEKLMVIEAILAWNGLSIHAQVAGMMMGTDLSVGPYIATRLLQVPLAVLLTYLFFPLLSGQHAATTAQAHSSGGIWYHLILTFCAALGVLLLLRLLHRFCKCILEYLDQKKYIIH